MGLWVHSHRSEWGTVKKRVNAAGLGFLSLEGPAYKIGSWDFPGGAVVKNLPANSGDTGSSPGPGRSHVPQRDKTHVPQLLSPRATTTEARAPRARAPQQEKPPQ